MKRRLHTLKETLEYRKLRMQLVAVDLRALEWNLEYLALKLQWGRPYERRKDDDRRKFPISN